MAGYLNRHRASRLMQERGLSALVLSQPESITYASGAFAGVASFWRRAGAAFVVVPADATALLAAIVGDLQAESFTQQSGITDVRQHPIWVETDTFPHWDTTKPARASRPAQYDVAQSLQLLRDLLLERGHGKSTVGLELGFIPAADYALFADMPFRWTDCTRIVEQLRSIKTANEISKLRHGAELAFHGLDVLKQSITPGMDAQAMTQIWRDAVTKQASGQRLAQLQSSWAYISVGGDGFSPGGLASTGDIIKVDLGCVVDGYSSDGARTLCLGEPHREARHVYDSLRRAFEKGLELLKPGTALKDIHAATVTSMWDDGFETYGRGHVGHGVGASIWSEEWPFISADATAVLEPSMVMAFETPWYIKGLGGFIIEDQVMITETGAEVMAPYPRDLISL